MPTLGGMYLTPKVGDVCSADHCLYGRPLLYCKAVGGHTVYLTLCNECYDFIQDNLEVTVLLLLVDEEEAIVAQVMDE